MRRCVSPPVCRSVRVHELGQFEGQPFCGLRIENVCISPVLFFLFFVLAVPSFFVIFVLEQFNFFAWLLFSGIVVLVGLCR